MVTSVIREKENMLKFLPYITYGIIIFFFIGFICVLLFWIRLVKAIVKQIGSILFSDSYQENLIETIPGIRHIGLQNILENNLRSESGDVLHRPLGSSKTWPNLDSVTFIGTQTTPFPISSDEEVDLG